MSVRACVNVCMHLVRVFLRARACVYTVVKYTDGKVLRHTGVNARGCLVRLCARLCTRFREETIIGTARAAYLRPTFGGSWTQPRIRLGRVRGGSSSRPDYCFCPVREVCVPMVG